MCILRTCIPHLGTDQLQDTMFCLPLASCHALPHLLKEDLDKEEDKMMVEEKVDKEVEVEVKRERQINMRLGGHFNEVINWRWSGHYKDEATLDSQLPIQCRHITGRHLDN